MRELARRVLGDRTTRWLVRFGYDGAGFGGWARQPGVRTVEGVLRSHLARHKLTDAGSAVEVASRTDRGVSALGNALTLRSPLAGPALLRALNGASPQIFFSAATSVPDAFRVRRAVSREYRYFFPHALSQPDRLDQAARLFAGSVDVRSFGRALPASEPVRRPVEFVRYEPAETGGVLVVRAPSFVWGMVRKIVGALREIDAGRVTIARLARAIAGEERLTLPIAEAEPLVLWNVEYGLPWQFRWNGPNRHQHRWWADARSRAETRQRLLELLAAQNAGRDPPPD